MLKSAPITLQPFEVQQAVQLALSPDVDGYVVSLSADVVDLSGNAEPMGSVMLHHIVFAKIGTRDYTCGNLPAERFYAEGEEHAAMNLPAGYGYPNRAAERWGPLYMLMNHHALGDTVQIRYTVRYVTGEQLTAVKPIWLDVLNCNSTSQFDVPGSGGKGSAFSSSARLHPTRMTQRIVVR